MQKKNQTLDITILKYIDIFHYQLMHANLAGKQNLNNSILNRERTK